MSSVSSRTSTEIKFIDRFRTLRRIRSKANQRLTGPPEETEQRHMLYSQSELANSFSTYLKKLEAIFAELQKLHTDFAEKMEKPGLNPEAWPELPHNAMYSFKLMIGKLAKDMADMWRGSLDGLIEKFDTCKTTLDRADELAWHDMRYEQKLNGLYKKMQGDIKSKKITRNEEKRRLIQQEHKIFEEQITEQLSELTTKQREEEQNQICTLMDSYCKNIQDFGVGLGETRRHIKANVKAGPKGWEGFLTRQVSSTGGAKQDAKYERIPAEKTKFQKSKDEWEERKRLRQQKSNNPFNDDVRNSSTSSNSDEPGSGDQLKHEGSNPFSSKD